MATSRSKWMVFVLFVGALGFLMPFVQDEAQGAERITLTGIFYHSWEDNATQNCDCFKVLLQNAEVLFNVERIERSQSTDPRQALRKVCPSVLRFWGSEEDLRFLEESENMGKPVTVTGYLYPSMGVLWVEAITYGEVS